VCFAHAASASQPLEAAAGGACVADGVPRVAVAEVVLDQAQVVAPVGQLEAAGVAHHVRVDGRRSPARAVAAAAT
jgi:hypothetical protein